MTNDRLPMISYSYLTIALSVFVSEILAR